MKYAFRMTNVRLSFNRIKIDKHQYLHEISKSKKSKHFEDMSEKLNMQTDTTGTVIHQIHF